VALVQLENDPLGLMQEGRRCTHTAGQCDLAIRLDVADLDDGPIELAEESVAHRLRQLRQVHVEKLRFAGVDAFAQFGIALVRRAEFDRIALGQHAVKRRARAGPGDHADRKGASSLVLFDGALGDFAGHRFGGSRGREAAKTNVVVVLDQCSRLGCCQLRESGNHHEMSPKP
jgi:hypothetical protein